MTIKKAISMIEYICNGSGDWCGSLGDGATGIALKNGDLRSRQADTGKVDRKKSLRVSLPEV